MKKKILILGIVVLSLIAGLLIFIAIPIPQQGIESFLTEKDFKEAAKAEESTQKNQSGFRARDFNHPTFIYQGDSLIYWSHNSFSERWLKENIQNNNNFVQTPSALYSIKKTLLARDTIKFSIVSLIENSRIYISPLQWISFHFKSNYINTVLPAEIHENIDIHKRLNAGWIWVIFLLIFLGSFSIAYAIHKRQFFIKKSFFYSRIVFFILLLLFTIPTLFISAFKGYWLTDLITGNGIIPLNLPFLFFVFSLLLYIVSSVEKINLVKKPDQKSKVKRTIVAMLAYSIISLSAILSILFINYIARSSNIDLNLDQLYRIGIKEIAFLVIYLLIFSVFFSLTQLIYRNLAGQQFHVLSKISGLIIGMLILLLGFYFAQIDIPIIPLLLSYLILVITLDLYQDKRHLNSTWIFTWMILICAFLSLILFNIDIQKDQSKRIKDLKSIIKDRDQNFENKYSTIEVSQWESKLKGTTLLLNNDSSNKQIQQYIKINDDLFFSPLSGDYLIQKFDSIHFTRTQRIFKPYVNQGLANHEALLANDYILYKDKEVFLDHNSFNDDPTELYKIISGTGKAQFKEGRSLIKLDFHSDLEMIQIQNFPGLLRPLSLFSLFFFILSITLFIVSLINNFFHFLPEKLDLKFFEKNSLRNRIQISIISLIIGSFISIGLFSNYYLQNLAKESNLLLQLDHAQLVQERMQQAILSEQNITEQALEHFSLKEKQIGREMIFLFDAQGEQFGSRNYLNQENPIRFGRLPYDVYRLLQHKPEEKQYRKISEDFNGVFYTIKGKSERHNFAFVPAKINHSNSSRISDILATFLSIYTLLFILSGVIAIVLSNSITKPIELLGKKLKGLKLSKKNESVQWKNEDEIGTLISIYNNMIDKLSDNARVMAKIERDSAWKEMAKQVAHEIKNPLTPLKLNIQYLESKVRMNPDEAEKLIGQITPGLIEQIDNLSQIASEFSNFAQLPTARNEKIRLNEIVKTVHDFFRKREDLDFQLFVPINDILVFADRNHLVRILNNVVKNAIQSIPSEREGEITINLYKKGDDAIIKVSDNGSGIPAEMQDKVFSPNFTTKSSGTGLGLAISINMLESFNGRIYFETEEDMGTDFFIEIPLMRLEDNYPDTTHVMLDD